MSAISGNTAVNTWAWLRRRYTDSAELGASWGLRIGAAGGARLESAVVAHKKQLRPIDAHMLYVRDEMPEVYAKTHKFLNVLDYLNLKLTGRFVATTDSIALHWVTDNRRIDEVHYDDQLLAQSSIPREKLPDLAKAVDVIGVLQREPALALGLLEGTPVVGGSPDVPAAAVGSGAVADFDGHVYVGTSAWLTCHVPFKKTDVIHNMASLPSSLPGRYFVANEQETAGACMTWLRDDVFCRDDVLDPGAPPQARTYSRDSGSSRKKPRQEATS